jgi:hypothetical protein
MRLSSLVPHRQIEDNTGEQSTFCNAQEEPCSQESTKALGDSHQCGDSSPRDHESGKPQFGRGALEDDVGGDFEEDLWPLAETP